MLTMVAVGAVAATPAVAQTTRTWRGLGLDGNWSTVDNWLNGAPAATGDSLVFDGSSNLTGTNTLPVTSVGEITYLSTAGAFTSVGTGTLAITGGVTNSSANTQTLNMGVTISGGQTISVASGGVMAFGSTGSALNQTVTGSGVTVTLSGAGEVRFLTNSSGTFNLFTPSLVTAGSVTLNASGLGRFTANVGTFRVGAASAGSTTNAVATTMRLAANTAITAASLQVGTNLGGGQSTNDVLLLGTSGTINATTIAIGQRRAKGTIAFDTGLINPTLTIRGSSGGVSKANVTLGNYDTSSTAISPRGTADFTLGTIDATLGSLIIGTITPGTGSGPAGGAAVPAAAWLMASGTVSADEVRLGYWQSGASSVNSGTTASVTGTLSLSGGSFTAGSLRVGDRAAAASSGTSRSIGIVNISGGLLSVTGTLLLGANAGGGVAADQQGTLTITGGTVSSSVAITTTNAQSTLTLNGGVLNMNGNAIGSASQQIGSNGGALNLQAGTLQSVSEINGGGPVTKTGTGTLVLAGVNTWTGTTSINVGSIMMSTTSALPGWNTAGRWSAASGATLAVANGVDDTAVGTLLGTGNFAAGSALGFDTSAGNRTYGALTGSVGLTKLGANTLTLSASNSYSGATTISGGTLELGNANAVAGGGNLTFAGGVLRYGAANTVDYSARIKNSGGAVAIDTNGQSVSFDSALDSTNTGGLTKLGSNTLSLRASNAYTGATTISGGTLSIGGSGVIGSGSYSGAISIASGASLTYASSAAQQLTGIISGSGGLRVAGTGPVTLSGANTFSGGIAVTSGTLLFGAANSIGSNGVDINGGAIGSASASALNITSGSFRFSSNFSAAVDAGGQLTLNVPMTLANGTRSITVLSGAGFNLYGNIGDDGSGYGLIKAGGSLMRLGGVNTYSGDTRSDGGTISVWTEFALQNSAVDVSGAGNFAWNQTASYVIGGLKGSANSSVFSSGAGLVSLRINPRAGVSNVYAGVLANVTGSTSNTMGIVMIGSGTQVFSGANTYTGTTEIRAGTLQIGNSGTTGRLSLSSAITGSAGGTLAFNRTNTVTQGIDFNSVIGGGIDVAQLGSGTLVLNGVNAHTGTTLVSAGVVRATNTSALGGRVTLAGGSLELANNASSTFGSGSGYGVTVTANSSIVIDRTSGGAAVTHQFGTLTIGSQTLSIMRGSNNTSGTGGLTIAGAATVSGAAGLDVATDMDVLFSGGFDGAGTLTKTGAGSLTLASQGHAGGFVINQGRLNIAAANILGNAGSLTLGSGVSLDNTSGSALTLGGGRPIALGTSVTFVGSSSLNLGTGATTLSNATTLNIAANTLTLGGDVTGGTYDLIKTGAGTLELAGLSGGSSYSGNTDIQAGRLLLSGTSQFANNTWVYVKNGATLEVGSSASVSNVNVDVAAGGSVVTNAVVNGNIRLSGNQTLTANTDYNGTQTIGSGAVVSMAGDYLGTTPATATTGRIVIENGGTLRATQALTINANKGIALSSGSATFNADFSTGSGVAIESVISGVGTLVKSGSGGFQLKNTGNSYSGGTVVEAGGTLGIWGDGSLGQAGTDVRLNGGTLNSGQNTSAVNVAAGRTIHLGNGVESGIDAFGGTGTSASGTFTLAANIVGGSTASLRINTAGKRQGVVVFSGSNSYSGATRVEAGKLSVNGSVAGSVQVDSGAQLGGSGLIAGNIGGSGLIGPGNSPGILTVQGQVDPTSSTSFAFEFMKTGAPIWSSSTASENDVLRLTNENPFLNSLTSSNIVNVYFEVADLASGDTFLGGFFSDFASTAMNFADEIGSPTYAFYVLGDGLGGVAYNGKNYYSLSSYIANQSGSGITGVTASVVTVQSANFSDRTVTNGQVTQFVIIPEPDTIIFAGIGITMAGWSLWKRRRIAQMLRK